MIRSVASHMLQWLRKLKQNIFEDFFLTDDRPVLLRPAITDQLWLGPATPVTVDGGDVDRRVSRQALNAE